MKHHLSTQIVRHLLTVLIGASMVRFTARAGRPGRIGNCTAGHLFQLFGGAQYHVHAG